ncbi:hypothetical protein P280DRAFT_549891 [Massarina eburnea CBS 473.64]|uniref:Cupin type-1 domain-containing protein n=1 Tax=Massarina eburnea CBS 473.64 TaxID=1395130 RepID=A0A6A6RY14_9PLEO|nr:hypothetical protein P280DRAFT_549891 [Massarina eburnea CBS 473.64]
MQFQILKAFLAATAINAVNALPTTPRDIVAPTSNDELIAKLKTDATAAKRYQRLLTTDGESLLPDAELRKAAVFDFNQDMQPIGGSNGGGIVTSSIENFPYLVESGLNVNFATIGPCGVLAPHVHPRSNEYLVVVDGEIVVGTQLELGVLGNGAPVPEFRETLGKLQGTLFPQGSIHYQVNNSPDCKKATFMTVFASEDPGATPVLIQGRTVSVNGTVKIERDDLGGLRGLLPDHIVEIVDQCVERCGGK